MKGRHLFFVNYSSLDIEFDVEIPPENIDGNIVQIKGLGNNVFSKYYVVVHNNRFDCWLSNCQVADDKSVRAIDCINLYAHKVDWNKLGKKIQAYMKENGKLLSVLM